MKAIKRRAQPLLGTYVEIAVPEDHFVAVDAAFCAVREVHDLMSFHESSSDVGRINRVAIGEAISCDPRTVEVLGLALNLYGRTTGKFDICIAPHLVKAGYLPADFANPLHNFIGTPADIELLDQNNIRLRQHVLIDLGGIAKGYAVDCAIKVLRNAGVPAAMVNAGGDLRCYGDEPWPVQLRNGDGSLGQVLSLHSSAIASSANRTTRKRKWNGRVTPHIGLAGRPVLINHTISVTARKCVIADAMTKVAMTDRDLANRLLADEGGHVLDPARAGEQVFA